MLRTTLVIVIALTCLPSLAGERKLTGPQIKQLLASHTLKGTSDNGDWTQDFETTGRTTYSQGNRNSPGTWQVKGDQYCSTWPPNPNVSCYDVTVEGDAISFISDGGGRTLATLAK